MSMPTLKGSDPGADLQALQSLVRWQSETAVDGLPLLDEACLQAALQAFRVRWLPAAVDVVAWQRFCDRLTGEVLDQPRVALMSDPAWGGTLLAGPITHDIAVLLRRAPLDEGVELDLAVRWWQQARKAGLPVDADFGACWRALEWTGLVWQLAILSRLPQEEATCAHRLAPVNKVALRYGPLKPLLKWLEPLTGAEVGAGYTF